MYYADKNDMRQFIDFGNKNPNCTITLTEPLKISKRKWKNLVSHFNCQGADFEWTSKGLVGKAQGYAMGNFMAHLWTGKRTPNLSHKGSHVDPVPVRVTNTVQVSLF